MRAEYLMNAPAKANSSLVPDKTVPRTNAFVRAVASLAPVHIRGAAKAGANFATASLHGRDDAGDAGNDAAARVGLARPAAAARFDDKFIETHHLIERYLERKLPPKGARDVEDWCRAHPEYLNGLNLAQRVQSSVQLLEAAGQPVDFSEPKPPWWKTPYLPIACVTLALASLVALWAVSSRNDLLRSELEDARTRLRQGSLEQPATHKEIEVSPDRAPGIDKSSIAVSRSVPILMDLRIDMRYSKASQYRLVVDKRGQGRALILNNLLKDSNGEIRLTFNTSGLSAGIYEARIDALPARGTASPVSEGWVTLEVN